MQIIVADQTNAHLFDSYRDPAWRPLADKLQAGEEEITKQLVECQGGSVDIGGYYHPDPAKTEAVMRPSKLFNELMDIKSML